MPDESVKPDTLSENVAKLVEATAETAQTATPILPRNAPVSEAESELERLISEAECADGTPVIAHPKPCEHVNANTINDALTSPGRSSDTKCPTCLWWFCTQCASPLDPKYCHLCLPESSARFVTEPLVDTDGVTHEGRVIHPDPTNEFFQPRFGSLAKNISEMSDPDLERYILHYKELVKQAEVALDFRRVVLGSSQLEQAQRADKQRRLLRNDKTKYAVKTLTVDKATGKQKKQTASTAELIKMMEALRLLGENRKKKADADAANAAAVAKSETGGTQ